MYFGYYEHSLDDKGRLMIPSKLREDLPAASPLFVIKGYEGCLSIYNQDTFNKLCERVEKLPYESRNARSYIRNLLGSVVQLNVDRLGRIQIPTSVLERYHISRQVVVLGVGDHFEIWDQISYQQYEEDNDHNFEDVSELLVNKGE